MSRGTRQDQSGDLSSVSHAYSFRHIDERGTQHVVWSGGFGIGASSYDVDTGIRGRGSERVNDGALRPVGQLEENVSGVVKRSAPGTVSNERNDAAKSSGSGSGSTASFGADSRGSVRFIAYTTRLPSFDSFPSRCGCYADGYAGIDISSEYQSSWSMGRSDHGRSR